MSKNQIQETVTNFWEVIQGKTIVVPQIQRDYAQGREEDDVAKIRIKILDKFYKAIKSGHSTDLDFIYGYIQNDSFIPLDGQQRLTTLFLVHWYILKRANVKQSVELKKFKYETRPSSTDFVRALNDAEIDFSPENDLKKWILDQRWFFHSWNKDPTISGMLTMIQAIHLKFGSDGEDYQFMWENLMKLKPITFNFLSINNSGLNDDLYIKMNSRGKALTRFENFKVWFEQKYPSNKVWQNKLDNEWTNLFWKYRASFNTDRSNPNTIDEEFMQFTNGMVMFELAKRKRKDDILYFANTTEVPLSKFEPDELNLFLPPEVELLTETLDWFYAQDSFLNEILAPIAFWQPKSIFETFISSQVTYPDRARFFSIVHFVHHLGANEFEKLNFFRWIRVTRNLIENTTIDSPDTFLSAVESISSIGNQCLNIFQFLENDDSKVSFFLQSQVEEEKLKAKLIRTNPEWEALLLDLENHELFRGSIAFLLLSALDSQTADFKTESDIALTLFDKDGSKTAYKKEYLLIRATLSKSEISTDIRLLDNGQNWRVLLKRKGFQLALKAIIQKIKSSENKDFQVLLQSIIDVYEDSSILWRYYIIKHKILLSSDSSRSKAIKKYQDYYYLFNNEGANWINNDNQFLLSNHRNELITSVLAKVTSFKLDRGSELDWWVKVDDTTKMTFYRGERIWLKEELGNYNLSLQFRQSDLIFGFHNDEKDKIEVLKNDYKSLDGWVLAFNFGNYPNEESDYPIWIEELIKKCTEIKSLVKLKVLTP